MHVEFLGIPRVRAGLSELEIEAETLGQALDVLAAMFPPMRELVTDGRLHPSLAASLNADLFISDPATRLAATDRLVILSADAGG
jgi:molybdopterin converting factor small subunit